MDESFLAIRNSIVIRITNGTSFLQDQLLQVDHEKKDNKGRSEIDVMCHLPSSIERRDYDILARFFSSIETRLNFFFCEKIVNLTSRFLFITILDLFEKKHASDRLEEISPGCASDERSACIEAFGTPALWFCHLHLCTSPSQVPGLSFYPSSSSSLLLRATHCCVVQVHRLSLSLALFLYLVRYENTRDMLVDFVCVRLIARFEQK